MTSAGSPPANFAAGDQILTGSGAQKGTFTPLGASSKLVVTGGGSTYTVADVAGIGASGAGATGSKGFVETTGFAAADPQVYGLEVVDSGGSLSTDLSTLLADINGTGLAGTGTGGGVTASLTDPTGGHVLSALGANIFISFPASYAGASADEFFGADFSQDPALSHADFNLVAVPEPASVLGFVIGSAGLLLSRRKRKA